ncbi:hypothetical protein ILUMI_22491 [Ignelater luminosus]|uniref:N(4)-(beta-N-acetylglucosaminyl)-L-asparaginase n=1 Tax=Ignelater luminosus TaxID=2038154 RepID=A0A8K0CED9_IGNLU|nr:hypothetical protein ILUMI_22491 [Ignelater luminosus]
MDYNIIFCSFILFIQLTLPVDASVPLVINTWAFTQATEKAWEKILSEHNNLEAIEAGCTKCEELQCDGTVGYGGSPDEDGESTLDALMFDGKTMDMGAVGGLRRVKNVISVAKHVLEHTEHSLLVGDLATKFAVGMGFREEDLSTDKSIQMWKEWKNNKCQPNFWKNVEPNPHGSCGPYKPISENSINFKENWKQPKFNSYNHDTISMIVIDNQHNVAAGTSTNGAKYKIPGRVGDSPIPGAGAYADNSVGAAVATGDGDVMMRFLPSFLAVEEMRRGKRPKEAAQIAINRIVERYPKFFGAVIAVNMKGEYSAACNGMKAFPFSVVNNELQHVTVQEVSC